MNSEVHADYCLVKYRLLVSFKLWPVGCGMYLHTCFHILNSVKFTTHLIVFCM